MSNFDINFYDFGKILSHETSISKIINPEPIKMTGSIIILPNQQEDPSSPTPSEPDIDDESSCSTNLLTNDERELEIEIKDKSESVAMPVDIDDVDYETVEKVLIEGSGNPTGSISSNEILLSIPGFKYNSDDEIIGNDPDIGIDDEEISYIPAYKLLKNTRPICNPVALMDADLWYRKRNVTVFGISDDDPNNTSKYVPRTERKFSNKFWSFPVPFFGSSSSEIEAIDYSDYKKTLKGLKDRLTPQGVSFTVKEYRRDKYYDINSPVGNTTFGNIDVSDLDNSLSRAYLRSQIFINKRLNTDFAEFEPAPTDMSFRELMRMLYDPDNIYDRRNIKSRDKYGDIEGINNLNAILSKTEYDSLYKYSFTQVARFLVPVDFGIQNVKKRVCIRGKEREIKFRKRIGIRAVEILFRNTSELSGFGKTTVEDTTLDEFKETVSNIENIDMISTYTVPNLPTDKYLRRMAFDVFGDVSKEGGDLIFKNDSTLISDLDSDIRNKVEFLITLLKSKFGNSRVILSDTTKSKSTTDELFNGESTYLSWHNYGRAVRILIYDSDGMLVKDNSDDFFKIFDVAKVFIKGCKMGWFGDPVEVNWLAQLVVNPDHFEWEFLPSGYSHKDSFLYREKYLNLINPHNNNKLNPIDIQEYLLLIKTKFDAHRNEISDIETNNTVDVPVSSLYGEQKLIDVNGIELNLKDGDYVELENQVDESINGIWKVQTGKWVIADKYIKWKEGNPISFSQMIQYYLLIGDYNTVRSLYAISFTEMMEQYDRDSDDYLFNVLNKLNEGDFITNNSDTNNNDRLRLIDPRSPSGFIDVFTQELFISLHRLLITGRSEVNYDCNITNGINKLFAFGGSFDGVVVGDIVIGDGIPEDTTVTGIYDVDFITISNPVTSTGTFSIKFKPAPKTENNNIHGQVKIEPSDISNYLRELIDGGYSKINKDSNSVLSESDRQRILNEIKDNIISEFDSIKKMYMNMDIDFANDNFNDDDYIIIENEFGLIQSQEILDLNRLEAIYNKHNKTNERGLDTITEIDEDDETVLNIFEETISIARGVIIPEFGRENPEIEPLANDIEIKRELINRFTGTQNKFDSRDF